MDESPLVGWARDLASRLMAPLGRRLDHVLAVGVLAESIGSAFGGSRSELAAAAYLHDVGYAAELALTGFHPLDGARFGRDQGHEELARLVAHHSGARYEARLRGIDGYEDEFPFMDSPLDRALTYCDLTTGPDGRRVSLHARVEEITTRYGTEHVVARSINACLPEFERACDETERLMLEAGVVLSGSLALTQSGSP